VKVSQLQPKELNRDVCCVLPVCACHQSIIMSNADLCIIMRMRGTGIGEYTFCAHVDVMADVGEEGQLSKKYRLSRLTLLL